MRVALLQNCSRTGSPARRREGSRSVERLEPAVVGAKMRAPDSPFPMPPVQMSLSLIDVPMIFDFQTGALTVLVVNYGRDWTCQHTPPSLADVLDDDPRGGLDVSRRTWQEFVTIRSCVSGVRERFILNHHNLATIEGHLDLRRVRRGYRRTNIHAHLYLSSTPNLILRPVGITMNPQHILGRMLTSLVA